MTIRTNVVIEGIDELTRNIGDPRILTAELKRGEADALRIVRDRAKANAAAFSTVLPNSVKSQTDGGLSGIIGSVARTGLSIEVGRKPGEAPSFAAIQRWIGHRGYGASQAIKSRRYVKPRKGSSAADDQRGEVFKIIAKIRESGTNPLPFITPAAHSEKEHVAQAFRAAVIRAIQRWVAK